MSVDTKAPLDKRMAHLAGTLYSKAWEENTTVEELREFLRDHATSVSAFARELEEAGGANPQANALLERCRRNEASTVTMHPEGGSPGWGLPDGYVYVVEARLRRDHAFECGIAPDGRVSS